MSVNENIDWGDTHYVESILLRHDITVEESQELYTKWAQAGTYDKLVGTNVPNYTGKEQLISAMTSLFPDPAKPLVLDVGAGTGVSGEQLRSVGFTRVDALEPHAGLAQAARDKNIYGRIIESFIGGDTPVAVPDDTYDAITSVGTFGPGHMPCSSVPEMVRLVKPGGYVVICMREECLRTVPEYRGRLDPLLDQLEQQGRWRKVKREVYPKHFDEKEGLLLIYQVC